MAPGKQTVGKPKASPAIGKRFTSIGGAGVILVEGAAASAALYSVTMIPSRLVVVVALALVPACGSGAGARGEDAGTEATMDAGDGGGSLWEMVVHPVSDVYQSVWPGAPGTIYAVARDDPSRDNGTEYSIASSHDDGQTWTTVPLTDMTQPIFAVVAIGAMDVYGFGFTANFTAAVAPPPLVAKSTDGGATFTLLHPSFSGSVLAAAADGAGNPIGVGAASDGGFFVRSTNGGADWSRVQVPGTSSLSGLWTTASGTIYACGVPASAPAPADGGVDGGDGGPAAASGGLVVRSDDDGDTWTTLTTTPYALTAISGTPDGRRIDAVGYVYTQIESIDYGANWLVHSGNDGNTSRTYSNFTSVWVPDALSAPFIAAGNSTYVVRGFTSHGPSTNGDGDYEDLPAAGLGLQSAVMAVAGNATEVWAVGAGIFRRR